MKRILSAIVLVSLLGAAAVAATVNGDTLTVSRSFISVAADGSATIALTYKNAATHQVHTRTLFVDSGCTKIVDQFGTTVAANAPAALCTAISSFTGQIDTLIANGASAGKLDL